MEYKILESNGTENENVDGAAFNNFVSGGKDGIIKGILNECSLYKPSSNSIAINTGELLIHGFRVKITSPFEYYFTSSPAVDTQYYVIAKIILGSDRSVLFDLVVTTSEDVVQDSLYDIEFGTYSCKIAQFLHTSKGISDEKILIEKIGYAQENNGTKLYLHQLDILVENWIGVFIKMTLEFLSTENVKYLTNVLGESVYTLSKNRTAFAYKVYSKSGEIVTSLGQGQYWLVNTSGVEWDIYTTPATSSKAKIEFTTDNPEEYKITEV